MTDTPATRRYVAVKFRIGDAKTFTYHTDGEAFADGDIVRVPDRRGDGWNKVYVVSTSDHVPEFATKAIIGRHVEERPAELDLTPPDGNA